jgi:hypothetical protein
LPFDVGNYLFASSVGVRKQDQQGVIKQMNFLVRDIETELTFESPDTPVAPATQSAAMNLIDGWYASNLNRNFASDLNENYVPPGWLSTGPVALASPEPSTAPAFYRQVVARGCRTCHIALPNADWDSARPWNSSSADGNPHVCGGSAQINLNGKMANSKVTFDLLWQSAQQSADIRALIGTHLGCGTAGVGISAPFLNPVFPSH